MFLGPCLGGGDMVCIMTKDLSRREMIAGGAAACLCGVASTASAQSYPILCSWAGGPFATGLSAPSQQAVDVVYDVIRVIGYNLQLDVFRGGVNNAAATILNGRSAVIYNPDFLDDLDRCNRIAPVTVLAHEVGHHANNDTTWAAQYRHPWDKELGADWVSGLAMRRLGVSYDDALSGILCSFGAFSPGTQSHPDSQRRLRAVSAGWDFG